MILVFQFYFPRIITAHRLGINVVCSDEAVDHVERVDLVVVHGNDVRFGEVVQGWYKFCVRSEVLDILDGQSAFHLFFESDG